MTSSDIQTTVSATAASNQPIRFLELLGLDEQQLQDYTIRLNSSSENWFDVMQAYYSDHDWLMDWTFIKKWPTGRANGTLKRPKVLQFIQLQPEDKTRWLFVGAYEVLDEYSSEDNTILYHRKEITKFAPLAGRAVVIFAKKPGFKYQRFVFDMNESYLQDFSEGMILEKVAQSPVSAQPFPGYENVRLDYRQLVAAVNNDEWKSALGSVQAIYLQTDRRTGEHYVGSAYSHKGINHGLLSRWSEYAQGDHSGDNKRLKELGARYIEDNFQYSILEIFDMRANPRDIINREHWWMDTLSSVYHNDDVKPHGYNSVAERNNDSPAE